MSGKTSLDELWKMYVEFKGPLTDFLSQSPDVILETVKQWLTDPASQPESIKRHWLLLAEVAKNPSHWGSDDELVWAEVAVLAYEHLAGVEPERHHENLWHAMLVRTRAVEHYGNKPDDYVCDVIRIVRWGLEQKLTLEQAKAVFERWESSSEEDVRELLNCLDKVRVLLRLSEAGQFTLNADFEAWARLEDAVGRRFFNKGKIISKGI